MLNQHILLMLDESSTTIRAPRLAKHTPPHGYAKRVPALFSVTNGSFEARVSSLPNRAMFRVTYHCSTTGLTLPGMRITQTLEQACDIAREILS